ncbi:MAG TPA: branched-chain amino acid ABC transporter substrate-binding protein [Stellaceae bacterium]|nr:branched-chain amino acid ABC transporter substrate-binding protein [Stellaceae bacterium]
MTERVLALLALLVLAGTANAAPLGAKVTVGYVELTGDPRYEEQAGPGDSAITPGRPFVGAEMAVGEVNLVVAASGPSLALAKAEGATSAELAERVDELAKNGSHWILVDAPDAAMTALAKAERGKDVVLFNISAPGDGLRQGDCQKNLLNVIPNRGMLADALAQFLVARKWPEVLVLYGPLDEDKAMTAAFEHSAKRFGLKISAKRPFLLSNDPRQREKDNVALLTGDASYDVVFVADEEGEFARDLPYHTIRPRPVIGATGLVPAAWHWAWDRYGGPQVSHRFERAASRHMEAADWSAWIAVRSLADAIRNSHAQDTAAVDAYLMGRELSIDGAKGPPLSYRAWDHQLRQPILLATADAVIAAAPMPGFLHATNVLDTLGDDQPESKCRF